MLEDWTDMMHDLPTRPVRQVHVGLAILKWVESLPKVAVRYGDDLAATYFGVPVVYDKTLHAGAWQGRDADGEVVASGQVGNPDAPLWYVPGTGFVEWPP